MLFIYNETKTPWELKQISDVLTQFIRSKTIQPKVEGQEQSKKTRAVSIVTHQSLFAEDDLPAKFKRTIETKRPFQVSKINSTVIFNDKSFHPFFLNRDENYKDLLLASVKLKGRMVTKINHSKTWLLEVFTIGGEMSFILSLNEIGAAMSIELSDAQTKKVTTITFSRTEEGIMVTKNTVVNEEIGETVDGIQLLKYRPARPTHVILANKKDHPALIELLADKVGKYNIVEYNKQIAADVITRLKEQHYRAVTVFANIPHGNKIEDVKGFVHYKNVADSVLEHFHTVFKMFNDGRVKKLKF